MDISSRRNGRDSYIILLTCVLGSCDIFIGNKEYIHFVCRLMLVYRMTLVPLRLFHKNLGNLQNFFWASGSLPLLPPWQKMARTGPMIALVCLTHH